VKAGQGLPVEKWDDRYSRNRDNLAHLPSTRGRGDRLSFADALAEILSGCQRMLAPDGHLVLTARPYRSQGALIDLPGQIIRLAEGAGLTLSHRHVALLCGLRASELVPRASFLPAPAPAHRPGPPHARDRPRGRARLHRRANPLEFTETEVFSAGTQVVVAGGSARGHLGSS